MNKITSEVLKEWEACREGFHRFNELFPDGETLSVAANALADDGHEDWSHWLYDHCRSDDRFKDQAIDGFRNTGHWNTGGWNTGDRNTGGRNTGHWNTGHRNTGDRNTGDRNTGDRNTGDRNTGDWNTGFFNTVTPDEILVFNRPLPRSTWNTSAKPYFIHNLVTTWWVHESDMTDAEKAADPNFYMRGGQLRSRTYKEAWRKAWNETSEDDRRLVLGLPNFDADVFLEISGIDVRVELA